MFAVVAEGLLGNVGDAAEFVFSGGEVGQAFGICDGGAQEVEEIDDRFEGVVDLMSDGCGHAACGGNFFCLQQGLLDAAAVGDVAEDLGGADDLAVTIFDGRDGE